MLGPVLLNIFVCDLVLSFDFILTTALSLGITPNMSVGMLLVRSFNS